MGQLRNDQPQRFDYAAGICSGGCSDIDMVWERHGHFLILENKRPHENITLGQLITLRGLNSRPEFTVMVAVGHPPDEIESFGVLDQPQIPGDVNTLRAQIQLWWDGH